MALSIQTTQNLAEQGTPWSTFFLYGSSGAGKTKAASTFPKPIFIIPANEGSHITLLQLGGSFDFIQVGKDTATGQRLPARHHMTQILDELERRYLLMIKHLNAGDEAKATEAFPWSTVVFESLTHYCDLVVEDISKYGQVQMNQQGWGHLSTHLRTIHDRIRNMDVHVVYTALDKIEQKGEGSSAAVEGGPNVVGAMSKKLPSACEVIGYCEVISPLKQGASPIYRTHFRKVRQFDARSRFNFPEYVDDFNFADLEPLMLPVQPAAAQ